MRFRVRVRVRVRGLAGVRVAQAPLVQKLFQHLEGLGLGFRVRVQGSGLGLRVKG